MEHNAIESPFFKIPGQLEQIPKDVPVVFYQLFLNSDDHKQWGSNLSKDLREKYRVYTLLVQYNRGGNDLIAFMQKDLKLAHRVLIQ